MKKIIIKIAFVAALVVTCANAGAQAPKAYRLTLAESVNAPAYALPITTVKVKVVVEKETVRSGPYARYAQKYFGTIGAMSDKDIYTIKEATISSLDVETSSTSAKKDVVVRSMLGVKAKSSAEFAKPSPDRMSLIDRSQDDMAKDAANTIFTLRKRRFDLVTGEAGEHVYGQGLKAAIDEMARMENEYLALFFGKHTTTTIVKEYDVIPERGKSNYVAFRFSSEWGVMSESDVSGDPVVLTVTAEGAVSQNVQDKQDKRTVVYYRVPDWAMCSLITGGNEIATARIPIYQYGATVAISSGK